MKRLLIAACSATLSFSALLAQADCNIMLQMHAPATPLSIDEKTQTIVDPSTSLMWMRCPLGYTLNTESNACALSEGPGLFTWQQALTQADSFTYSGFDDWRLPNRKELDTIVDRHCFEPAINTSLFPNTPVESFWTNSPYPFNGQSTWGIEFEFGGHKSLLRSGEHAARLVRDM